METSCSIEKSDIFDTLVISSGISGKKSTVEEHMDFFEGFFKTRYS